MASAEVDGGDFGSGGGVVGATPRRNIIANNGGFGYQEFTERTNAILRRNLFFANALGHYFVAESALGLWLLIKGVDVRRWDAKVRGVPDFSAGIQSGIAP